jgi:hypothetical protein
VTRTHFRTRAELERQMNAARQLRAEALAGASWIVSALAGAEGLIHRIVQRVAAAAPRQA